MSFDQFSLLAAIGFSGAALSLTLLVAWLGARSEAFLINWAAGIGVCVIGSILFSGYGLGYAALTQGLAFLILICGFALVLAGAMQYRGGRADWPLVGVTAAIAAVATILAFASGLTGIGTAVANFGIAILLAMAAWQYWQARREAWLALVANATLYGLTAASFALCGLVLLVQRDFVLTARPANWAESLNSIMVIIGLTGIGAISLALNQTRIARAHRDEARTDPLTRLLNRRYLFERFGQAPVPPGTAAIVFDLDRFKAINDQLGHAAGDFVLVSFAQILKECADPDMAVARLGGEEFCIVVPGTTPARAAQLAEKVRTRLESESMSFMHGRIEATVSAGVALSLGEPEPFDLLLGRADNALYKAKRDGRNRVASATIRRVA